MTYVREQTSAELAAHMRSLKKIAGWFDPLSDRLWQEVEALQAQVAGLKTGYEAYERVNAEMKQKVANLEVCQTASLGISGIIKCVAGELGFDAAGEDSAHDYLIGLARQANGLKAECEGLRANSSLVVLLPELDLALEDLEIHGQHSDQGYRKLKDWYRKVNLSCKAIDAAMGKGEQS